jgi:N-acetylmuramoyl-L-alanine amidase
MTKYIDIRKDLPKHPTRTWATRDKKKIDTIIVHCTGGTNQDPKATAKYHITPGPQNKIDIKGAPGICYHDFIDRTGTIYHCNDYTDITWHSGSINGRSIGVVMAFEGKDKILPPTEQMVALVNLLTTICLYTKILPERVMGHREVPGMYILTGKGSKVFRKVCPGMGIDLDKLRDLVTRELQQRLKNVNLYTGDIDGKFGPNSKAALKNYYPELYK